MQSWKRIDPTATTQVGHRTIISKTFLMPDASTAQFENYDLEGQEYVAVIALTEDNKVITALQFRSGPERMMYELPGGGVDGNESLDRAVYRELLEETGYESHEFTYLGFAHKDSLFNATHHYYLARNCKQSGNSQELDLDEHIEVTLLSIDGFIKEAKLGNISDTSGIFLGYDQLKLIQEEMHA